MLQVYSLKRWQVIKNCSVFLLEIRDQITWAVWRLLFHFQWLEIILTISDYLDRRVTNWTKGRYRINVAGSKRKGIIDSWEWRRRVFTRFSLFLNPICCSHSWVITCRAVPSASSPGNSQRSSPALQKSWKTAITRETRHRTKQQRRTFNVWSS